MIQRCTGEPASTSRACRPKTWWCLPRPAGRTTTHSSTSHGRSPSVTGSCMPSTRPIIGCSKDSRRRSTASARFAGPREVDVRTSSGEDVKIQATTVVVGTGTVPARPDIPGIDLPGVYDSTTIQHATPFPQRLAVIGSGFVGLEFANMFQLFGSQVTVLDAHPDILPNAEPVVVAHSPRCPDVSRRHAADGCRSAADRALLDGAARAARRRRRRRRRGAGRSGSDTCHSRPRPGRRRGDLSTRGGTSRSTIGCERRRRECTRSGT